MSRGSAKVTIRCGSSVKDAVDAYLEKRKKKAVNVEPWTFTDFVLQAVTDKLNHIERSSRSKHKWVLIRQNDQGPYRITRMFKQMPVVSEETGDWTEEDTKKVANMSSEEWSKRNLDEMIKEE